MKTKVRCGAWGRRAGYVDIWIESGDEGVQLTPGEAIRLAARLLMMADRATRREKGERKLDVQAEAAKMIAKMALENA